MRRVILLTLLLLAPTLFAQNSGTEQKEKFAPLRVPFIKRANIVLQYSVPSGMKLSYSGQHNKFSSDGNFSLGIEFPVHHQNSVKVGFGSLFQFESRVSNFGGKYRTTPVYVFVDYPILRGLKIAPKLVCKFGYNFLSGTKEFSRGNNGSYYAIGVSEELSKNIDFKVLYSVYIGKFEFATHKIDFRSEEVSFSMNFHLL